MEAIPEKLTTSVRCAACHAETEVVGERVHGLCPSCLTGTLEPA